jgi:hypothetical protein
MVQPGFADLVNDNGGVMQVGVAQQAIEQRGLAAAEKAGEEGDGNARIHKGVGF